MKGIKSVPMPIYENEMGHKNSVIKMLIVLIGMLCLILGISVFMFVKFIGSYEYVSYTQDGSGVNNINKGTQGDIVNESTLNN